MTTCLDPDDLVNSGRRSVRWYSSAPVAPCLVEDLLHRAVQAPSAHNRQPWRFAVLTDAWPKSRLAEAMAKALRRDRERDGDPADAIEADAQRSVRRIVESPAVIVVAASMVDMDRYPDARRTNAELVMAIQGTAMAVQNLLLAAHEEGLGACVICAPLFCPDEVLEALRLPSDWMPQCAVTLGRPAVVRPPRPRRPLGEVVVRIGDQSQGDLNHVG